MPYQTSIIYQYNSPCRETAMEAVSYNQYNSPCCGTAMVTVSYILNEHSTVKGGENCGKRVQVK